MILVAKIYNKKYNINKISVAYMIDFLYQSL